MSEATIESVVEVLNRFPAVFWDRCIDGNDHRGEAVFDVYGWIPRDGRRKDFLLVRFNGQGDPIDFTTSSARHSETIMERLYGTAEGHTPCQRVADVFGDRIPNRVGA